VDNTRAIAQIVVCPTAVPPDRPGATYESPDFHWDTPVPPPPPGPGTISLHNGNEVSIAWSDRNGKSGIAAAVLINPEHGGLFLLHPDNIEVVVSIVRPVNSSSHQGGCDRRGVHRDGQEGQDLLAEPRRHDLGPSVRQVVQLQDCRSGRWSWDSRSSSSIQSIRSAGASGGLRR
jgi:hypothetical protein